MSGVGAIERETQNQVAKLFVEHLGYEHLGDWEERVGNSCVESEYLLAYLLRSGYSKNLALRAIDAVRAIVEHGSKNLYDKNEEIYQLLRYGVKVKPELSEVNETVWLIDWGQPEKNHFAIAEEVTVAPTVLGGHSKRPDIVLYVNGIALGVLELKRSTISVAEGIRQNLDNQKREFIEQFFSTMAWVMAGNETEGLRYGTIQTKEKYFLTWKEESAEFANPLERGLAQMCNKKRFLELIHDFIVFDATTSTSA
jgi:type I restriction enzyme R subunit